MTDSPQPAAADDTGRHRWLVDVLLVLMVVAWGVNYSILKRVFQEVPPMVFNTLRLVLASLVFLAAIGLARWQARRSSTPLSTVFYTSNALTGRDCWNLVWLGLIGHGLYQWFFGEGLARTSASNGALIIGSTPVLVTLASVALGRDRVAPLHWIGAGLSAIGIYLVVGRGASLASGTIGGDLLVLCAAVCWAAYTIGGTGLMSRHSPLFVTGATMAIGTIPYALASIPLMIRVEWHAVSVTLWLLLIPAALFALCFAYVVWYMAVKELGPARTSIYANAVPLVAIFFAVIWLGEPISRMTWIGTAAVVGGVFLTRVKK